MSNVFDNVSQKDLEDFEDAKRMGKFVAGRNPLKSVTTPLHSTDEGSYEAAAVLYAASACGVPDMGVIYGAGGGSTQISAVQNGAIVGTSFYELGSKKGVKILQNKKDLASLTAAVGDWGKFIEDQLQGWTMASSNPDIHGRRSIDFLKENSENMTVVGISAVYYSMSFTKEIDQIDPKTLLPRIKQPDMVDALQEKLKALLNYQNVNGAYKTTFKTFDKESSFLTELANVKLHLSYATLLYHRTATFTLAREWKVNGKPFRTTWSTGWYV